MVNSARNYVFTINNPRHDLFFDGVPEDVLYCTWELEIGESGTVHYQGMLQLKRRMTMASLCRWSCFERAHFEPMGGTPQQARDYARKEGKYADQSGCRVDGPWEVGQFKDFAKARKEAGKRSQRVDLLRIRDEIKRGRTVEELAGGDMFDTVIKFKTNLLWYQFVSAEPRNSETICFVLWGSSKAGKTRTAMELASMLGDRIYQVAYEKSSGLYWDGYRAGDVVVIDEFDGSRMNPKLFNMLIDRYPMKLHVHGNFVEFNSKYVFITSNKHPSKWWPNQHTPFATQRRIICLPVFLRSPFVFPPCCRNGKQCAMAKHIVHWDYIAREEARLMREREEAERERAAAIRLREQNEAELFEIAMSLRLEPQDVEFMDIGPDFLDDEVVLFDQPRWEQDPEYKLLLEETGVPRDMWD